MNLLRNAEWMRRLSVLADDERARQGHPDVATQHLLLGLVLLGGPVTSALREAGVTPEDVRRTFAAIHAERISGLGVHVTSADPHAPIPPLSERGEVAFSERALRLLKSVSYGAPEGASVALWTSLRVDPLTGVDEVLNRLGVDPLAVDEAVRAYAEQAPDETGLRARPGTRLELGYRYDFPVRRGGLLRMVRARVIAFAGGFYLRGKADDISRALG
ncbi:Clp protease N-terminal domain-containing protein [Ammonicoccus fulvus]|uniref:Clp protease N-terminal domain-containing protein n=1 Tax=Ammonicoccus fulvus TaxID=3138240 RepID=A0ABZ3FQN8_9ACTN